MVVGTVCEFLPTARFIVPFLQGYVDSGEFGMFRRIIDSLKVNIRMYIFTVLTFVILTIYLLLSTNAQTLYSAISSYSNVFSVVEGPLAL